MKINFFISVVLAGVLGFLFFLFGQNEASLHHFNHPQNHDALFLLVGTAAVTVGLGVTFLALLTSSRRFFWSIVIPALLAAVLLDAFSDYQLEPATSLQWKSGAQTVKANVRRLSVRDVVSLGVALNAPNTLAG
jgi:hypothetical protein